MIALLLPFQFVMPFISFTCLIAESRIYSTIKVARIGLSVGLQRAGHA